MKETIFKMKKDDWVARTDEFYDLLRGCDYKESDIEYHRRAHLVTETRERGNSNSKFLEIKSFVNHLGEEISNEGNFFRLATREEIRKEKFRAAFQKKKQPAVSK